MKPTKSTIAATLAAATLVTGCAPGPEDLVAEHTSTINRYCLDCHNAVDQEAGLVLEGIDLAAVEQNAELLETIVMKLEGRMMPPPGGARPSDEERESLTAFLIESLDAAAAANPDLGRMAVHRLNRTEYGNAVRDLLGLSIDAAEYLPADDEAYGFDNIADVLRVSPSLMEQYLSASSKLAALAVGDPETQVVNAVYRAPPDLGQYRHVDGLPLGTRGGLLLSHYLPLDA